MYIFIFDLLRVNSNGLLFLRISDCRLRKLIFGDHFSRHRTQLGNGCCWPYYLHRGSYVSMIGSNGLSRVVIQSMNIPSGVTCTVCCVYVWRYISVGPRTWDSDISGRSSIVTLVIFLSRHSRTRGVIIYVLAEERLLNKSASTPCANLVGHT